MLKHGGNPALGFTVNSGQPKEGVTESLAAPGLAQARIVDRSKLFCAIATTVMQRNVSLSRSASSE